MKQAIFDKTSHLKIELKQTERRLHANKITNKLNIDDYDGLITISGDGLMHEVINGAMCRADRELFLNKITFGFIPAGTGNGLVTSILDE